VKKFLSVLALASLPFACSITPAVAVEVGDVIGARLGCTSMAVVERQIEVYEKHGRDAVQAQFQVDVANGECSAAPAVIPVEVQEVGTRHGPLPWDGGKVYITPVRFGDKFYTAALEDANDA
jgi:hypothetical protein